MARDRAARTRRQFVQGSLAMAGLGLVTGCGRMVPLPGQRPASKIFGLQIVDTDLQRDRRQHAADEAHVMVPGQPADAAIRILNEQAETMGVEVIEQGAVGGAERQFQVRFVHHQPHVLEVL